MSKTRLAKRRIAATATAFAAAMGFAVLSGGTADATASSCATISAGENICLHIDGSSNIVADAIGSVSVTAGNGIGEYALNGNWVYYLGHVQVVNSAGTTLCNSNTITLTHGAGTSCESPYQGATVTGNYCAILWVYNGEYHNYGKACVNVIK